MQIIIDRDEGPCVVGEHPTLPPCPEGGDGWLLFTFIVVGLITLRYLWERWRRR